MTSQEHDHSSADIVIVDDTPANLQVLTEILEKAGYQVRGFPDGAFALQSITAALPDLILLDIRMPEMDGYAVCAQLKADERARQIPVIFISALDDIRNKVQGFAAGGVDYITKPFQAEEVLARVRTHLMLRDLQTQLVRQNTQLTQEVVRRTQAEAELRALNMQLQQANRLQEETNRRLQTMNRELQEANASKDRFFSIVAHDLRSPFTGLIGLTAALIESPEYYSQEKRKRILQQMHTTAKTTYELLTNLLMWSRLKRGLLTTEPQKLLLADIAGYTLAILASNAENKQISIKNLIPEDVAAYADLKMVNTVIRNLLTNAVKFTDSGGTITFSAQLQGEQIDISIVDTGVGMSQAQMKKLFRLDERLTKPGTAGEEGTGLGLILCKELIETNGGRIWVESESGKGTCFTFSLPRYQDRGDQEKPER